MPADSTVPEVMLYFLRVWKITEKKKYAESAKQKFALKSVGSSAVDEKRVVGDNATIPFITNRWRFFSLRITTSIYLFIYLFIFLWQPPFRRQKKKKKIFNGQPMQTFGGNPSQRHPEVTAKRRSISVADARRTTCERGKGASTSPLPSRVGTKGRQTEEASLPNAKRRRKRRRMRSDRRA
jgi:hypothetical protein